LRSHCRFTVFGVGSKAWRTFQLFPRKIQQRLSDLGATTLINIAEGDVTTNSEDKFTEWMEAIGFIIQKNPTQKLPLAIDRPSCILITC
jgi:sulfite reductase alpha subunit-like flavoprotein